MKSILLTLPLIGLTALSGCSGLGLGGSSQQFGSVPDENIDLRLADGTSAPSSSAPTTRTTPSSSSGFSSISNATGDTYRLRKGQTLKLDGYKGFARGQRIFSETVTIDSSGAINITEVGKIHIGGFTIPEASNAVEARIRGANANLGLNTKVHVAAIGGQLISYVSGRVKNPGKVTFRPGMTVASAINAAGGRQNDGSGRDISVTSEGVTRVVTLPNGDKPGSGEMALKPGDTIQVQRSIFGD